MANHKSAEKRARQTKTRTVRNKSQESSVKSAVKKVRAAIEANDKSTAATLLVAAQSLLARLAKKGVIKDNTASRKTGRLASQINKL